MTVTNVRGRILLPRAGGGLERYVPGPASSFVPPVAPLRSRIFYAAAHVVCDPLADGDPTSDTRLDWDATLAYRRYLWSYGLGVAEAMDTAQRGDGLPWPAAQELIRRSATEARAVGASIVCGVGTDQLDAQAKWSLDEIEAAYEEQCAFVEGEGAGIVLLASRALAQAASGPHDYVRVYGRVLSQVSEPVILHWLGTVFDPKLEGYWGSTDIDEAGDVVIDLIRTHRSKVDGVKLSLLDRDREIALRRRLPKGVRMYTGDDLHYPELIRGDGADASDALLGIFDAIAPAASAALQALDADSTEEYDAIMRRTVPLARHVFAQPVRHYKTGIVFLAYLNGHQSHFRMAGGLEGARSVVHLAELFVLADRTGLLADPELASTRMARVLSVAGIEH